MYKFFKQYTSDESLIKLAMDSIAKFKTDEDAEFLEPGSEEWIKSALDAGIPLSVILGKTKLSDHFSKEYIASQCGITLKNEDE